MWKCRSLNEWHEVWSSQLHPGTRYNVLSGGQLASYCWLKPRLEGFASGAADTRKLDYVRER